MGNVFEMEDVCSAARSKVATYTCVHVSDSVAQVAPFEDMVCVRACVWLCVCDVLGVLGRSPSAHTRTRLFRPKYQPRRVSFTRPHWASTRTSL